MTWWRLLLGVAAGLVLVYGVLLALLWRYARAHPETVGLRDALRLLPDLLRLLRRLLADGTLPTGVRVRVALLVAYLAMPFDLVPDVVPVIGYADDDGDGEEELRSPESGRAGAGSAPAHPHEPEAGDPEDDGDHGRGERHRLEALDVHRAGSDADQRRDVVHPGGALVHLVLHPERDDQELHHEQRPDQ